MNWPSMPHSSAANRGSRSQQAGGAEARNPWDEAAAALCSRTPIDQWGRGTGTRQSTEAPFMDTWGPRASTEAPVMETWGWGPRASTGAPVTVAWGAMASTVTSGPWASREATVTGTWGTRSASREAPVMDTWGPRSSTVAPVIDGWGTMASTRAPVTDTWITRASEAERDAWGPGWSAPGDNWARSTPERSRFSVPPPSESEVVLMNISARNAKAFLHCGGCSLALKPPIFQCDAGHAVCLSCRDELLGRGTGWTCNVCRGPGFRRCRFLENLVESLRVSCPNAARGCVATPAYYDLHAHRMACAHGPSTPCPVRACGFVAAMAALVDHLTALHGWPLTSEERAGKSFDVDLRDGFNLVATAARDGGNQQHLLLLNVVRQPFGRTISAVCVHPQPAVDVVGSWEAKTVELELCYSAARHYQESVFSVPFVDLADGLPNELAQFVVPKSVHPDDDAAITVTAFLTIK